MVLGTDAWAVDLRFNRYIWQPGVAPLLLWDSTSLDLVGITTPPHPHSAQQAVHRFHASVFHVLLLCLAGQLEKLLRKHRV